MNPGDLKELAHGGIRWKVADLAFSNAVAQATVLADSGQGPFESVKTGTKKNVYRWTPAEGDDDIYLKIYMRDRARYLFKPPPAEKEAMAIMQASQAGVGTTRLLAFGAKHPSADIVESVLVSATPKSAIPAGKKWLDGLNSPSGKAKVETDIKNLMKEIRRLHDCGLCHRDLNPGNILFCPNEKNILFIDFHRSVPRHSAKPKDAVRDILKPYLYVQQWFSEEEWAKLAESYFSENSDLRESLLTAWDRAKNDLFARRLDGITRACLKTRGAFRKTKSQEYVIYSDSRFDTDAICAAAMGKSDSGWEITPNANRQDWEKAVREHAAGTAPNCPVAFVEKKKGSALILGEQKPAPYCLSRQFSLEGFI